MDAATSSLAGLLEDQRDPAGHALPLRALGRELPGALFRHRVKLGHTALLGFPPLGLQVAAFLQAIQRGVERSLLNVQSVARDLPDALGDGVAVNGAEARDFQDQQIQLTG